jgi:YHS domain-containing protein
MKTKQPTIFRNLFFLLISACLVMSACQSATSKTETTPIDTMAMKKDTTTQVFDHLLVDNRKDPSCGMPVTAGIGDTAHYKNKVLGFCSKECKDAFEKNPEAMLAAAEIKK